MMIKFTLLCLISISCADAHPFGGPSREILQSAEPVDVSGSAAEEQASFWGWSLSGGADDTGNADSDVFVAGVDADLADNATSISIALKTDTVENATQIITTTGALGLEEKKDQARDKKGVDILMVDTTTVSPRTSTLLNLINASRKMMEESSTPAPTMTVPIVVMMSTTFAPTTQAPTTAEPTVSYEEIVAHESSLLTDKPKTSTPSSSSFAPSTSSSTTPASKIVPFSSTTNISAASIVGTPQPVGGNPTGTPSTGGNAASTLLASSMLAVVAALCLCL